MPADSKGRHTAAAGRAERHGRFDGAEEPVTPAADAGEEEPLGQPRAQVPQTFRELGSAIFTEANPVKAGVELLDPGNKKADATRLNALKTFAEWVFGKPGGELQRKPPRVIWDLPCPPYEPVDPVEPQDLEGGEE